MKKSIYNNSMVESSAQTPIQGFAPNHFHVILADAPAEFDVSPGTIWQADVEGSFNYDNGSVALSFPISSTYVIPRGVTKLFITAASNGVAGFAGAATRIS